MIKAAVFSDTHTNTTLMVEAVKRLRPDVIIHLGDHESDAEILRLEFPEIALYCVRGNCDMASSAPDTDIVPLGPVKAFITHGHIYDVKWGLERLAYVAMENDCKIAMFGHTHFPENSEIGSVKLLNPGTAGRGFDLSYAEVEVFDNGAIATSIKIL